MHVTKVAGSNGGVGSAALMQNKLCAEKDVTGVASRGCAGGRVDEWLGGEQQLQPLRHSELHYFVDPGARGKFC